MSAIFFLLFFISPIVLIIGVIKPKIFTKIFKGKTLSRSKIAIIFAILTFVFFILSVVTSPVKLEDYSQVTSTPTKDNEVIQVNEVGKEAYLRLGNISSNEQKILISPSEEISSEVTSALIAKDWYGLQELMLNKGVFAVPNGTKVLVIDISIGLRKVRVLEGDMQYKAGWLPMEYVVSK
jgi:hypothetical protein